MNKFDNLTSEEMEDIQSDSSSVYMPDQYLINKGYEWDSSGLYIPYTFRYENNPDRRDIYLKIERLPDKKTEFIIYSWNYKKDGEFKRLNFFRRNMLPVEEDIDSKGKASINKSLSDKGRMAGLDAIEGTYKEFMESVIMEITMSESLEVFKDLDYDFPIPEDQDDEESEDSGAIHKEIQKFHQRQNLTLNDEEVEIAMEVRDRIHDDGLIPYYDSFVDKFHKGTHKAIYRKHLGGVNVIRNRGSYFLSTLADAMEGKSLEDKIAFLMMIPEIYLFVRDDMSLSSFSRYSDIDVRFFERVLIYFGDFGNKKAYEKVEEVFDAIKKLITEKQFSRDLTEGNSSNFENKTLELIAESIGAIFQTVRYDFFGDEKDQIQSRSIDSTPFEANKKEIQEFNFALKMDDSIQNKEQREGMKEIDRYKKYLLWLVKEDIKVIVPYRSFFVRFSRESKYVYRFQDQMVDLFEAYCTLTYMECDVHDGHLIASQDQLRTFISEILLENTLPPVESNFIKMLISKGNKTELKIFPEDDEDKTYLIEEYEGEVIKALKYNRVKMYEEMDEDQDNLDLLVFSDLEEYQRRNAINKLMTMYRLGGTGFSHLENVFFRVDDLRRVYSNRKAFKDVDEIGKLLNNLYTRKYIDKLQYKDKEGRVIYYLTNKCEEIMNPIKLESEDITDAINFLHEQGINYDAESIPENAESGEKNAG